MQNFSLLDYLKDSNILSPELFDSLKFELDQHIYFFGDHFKYHKEKDQLKRTAVVSSMIKHLFVLYQILKNKKIDTVKKTILSNSYFSVNSELRKLNFNVFSPSWRMTTDRIVLTTPNIYFKSEKIKRKLESKSFSELTSRSFTKLIDDFNKELSSFFIQKKISAIIVPNDISFFENVSIQLCRRTGIPSFIFLHGLPGRYNIIDENRSDYLIVWGEKIKEAYVKTGFDPSKIYISGHPYYKSIPDQKLRFSLENILVLTKSMNGGQHGYEVILGDRGNTILYLLKVQTVLKSLGVKSVYYRPHPSENPAWYSRYIDTKFFILDTNPLVQSFNKATLVIGPTSTVMIESLYNGVNYLIFEPCVNDIDLLNYPLVPPFDGSDNKIPVAKNESELNYFLKNKIRINPTCLKDYIATPFDLSFVKKII